MTTAPALRRMTNKIETPPAPDAVLMGGGSGGDLSVVALRLIEKLEALGRAIKRIFIR